MRRFLGSSKKTTGSPASAPTPSGPPAKWTVRQLLDYCSKHDINVISGLSKEELVSLVDEHYTNALLAAEASSAMRPNEEHLQSLSGHTATELLGYTPYKEYGAWLYKDVETLRAIVEAGIAQMRSTEWFAQTMRAEQVPPLVSWMAICLRMGDGGKTAAAALVPANASSAVCGHYLNPKEMVARCEECSADSTCVFCMECFQNSPCRSHRFRITPSGGGGMCDCGDPSAWKPESFCTRHRGHRDDEDPTAALTEENRTWATLALRGTVQAISLTLQQSLAWMQTGAGKADNDAKKSASRVALVKRLEKWLSELAAALLPLSQASEAAKRLISQRWVEAIGDSSGCEAVATGFAAVPCLDAIFAFELNVADTVGTLKSDSKSWWMGLIQSVGMGLSDPFFRNHYLTMMGKYAERLSKSDALDDYAVQVYTNVDAIRYALLPQHMPYQNPKDTIVHRAVSGCLYYFTAVVGDKEHYLSASSSSSSSSLSSSSPNADLAMLLLDDRSDAVNLASFSKLRQCVGLAQDAGVLTVLNTRAWRGIQVLLHIVDLSSAVRKNAEAPSRQYLRTATFASRYLTTFIKSLQGTTRRVLGAYDEVASPYATRETMASDSGDGDGGAAKDGDRDGPDEIDMKCLEKLGLTGPIAAEVFRAVAYDVPPDATAAASQVHACALRIASAGNTSSTDPHRVSVVELLTPQERRDRALCCVLTQLETVREFLLSYLTIQQNSFRRGNAAIVLEARPHLTASGVAVPAPAESHIYAYDILEQGSHAVGTSNLLSRLFMMLIQVWVMHVTRAAGSTASPASSSSSGNPNIDEAAALRRRLGAGRQAPAATGTASVALGERGGDGVTPTPTTTTTMPSPFSQQTQRTRPVTRLAELLVAREKLPVSESAHVPALFRNAWLDAVLMPFVLLTQVEAGLWRRDEYNVNSTMRLYKTTMGNVHMEYDLYALQMLTTMMPSNDFATHVLERFSYADPEKEKKAKKADKKKAKPTAAAEENYVKPRYPTGNRPGYARFIRLVLTLVLNSGKARGASDFTQETVTQMVAQEMALSRSTHSALVAKIDSSLQHGMGEDEEYDEVNTKIAVRAALKQIAVEEESPKGRVFRLKDAATWQRLVSLYDPQSTDEDRESLFNQYRSTIRMEQLTQAKAKAGAAGDADSAAARKPVHFPPPTLPSRQSPELLPHLRALLHTDALLLSSLDVICTHVSSLRVGKRAQAQGAASADARRASRVVGATAEELPVTSNSSSSNSSTDNSDDDDDDSEAMAPEAARKVLQSTVQHAVTALYLCAKDTAELSRALRYENNALFVEDGGVPTVPPADDPVDWERVRDVLKEASVATNDHSSSTNNTNSSEECSTGGAGGTRVDVSSATPVSSFSSYTDESVCQVLPLSALRQAGTLRDLLSKPLPPTVFKDTCTATGADVLHELWLNARENAEEDNFGVAQMLRYVLQLTELARDDLLKDDGDSEQTSAENADALARKRQLKERQSKILQRMRIRAGAAVAAADASATATASKTAEGEVQEDNSPNSPLQRNAGATPEEPLFLYSRLLMRLSTLDCCVCRVATEEPLLFLANYSTSGVLHHLGAMPLPDGREVHAHFTICGHVAHARCVRKYFTKLATLWRRGFFQGQRFLGPSEFACPICLLVSQAQIPVPTLVSAATAPAANAEDDHTGNEEANEVVNAVTKHADGPAGAPAEGESLFEDVRRSSLADADQQEAAASSCTAVAQASIGFCATSDNAALVITEDALQRDNSEAWGLSETIRTIGSQLHLLAEGAKVGRAVNENDLLAVLSLMISLPPQQLATHYTALKDNFARCREAFSLLLLDLLCAPRTASARIAEAVRALVQAPEVNAVALAVLNAVDSATTTTTTTTTTTDPLAEPAAQQTCMALWGEFACLTLLKALLVDTPVDTVLKGVGSASEYDLCFTPLTHEALATAEARQEGLLRMWQFLSAISLRHLNDPLEAVATALRAELAEAAASNTTTSAAAPLDEEASSSAASHGAIRLSLPTATPAGSGPLRDEEQKAPQSQPQPPLLTVYETPEQWGDHILQTVLHLPHEYMTILSDFARRKACELCSRDDNMSVQCRFCEKRLCLRPSPPCTPELLTHSVQCGRGVGVYLRVDITTVLITDAVSGRCVERRPLYVDDFEETDENMVRGAPLHLSRTEAQKFLHVWLMNRWAVESSLLKSTWLGNLNKL